MGGKREPITEKVIEKVEEVSEAEVNNVNVQMSHISNQDQVGFYCIKIILSYWHIWLNQHYHTLKVFAGFLFQDQNMKEQITNFEAFHFELMNKEKQSVRLKNLTQTVKK